jgi:hypothetical protein
MYTIYKSTILFLTVVCILGFFFAANSQNTTFTPFKQYMNSSNGELRGWVDMHAHPMSHLGFGGTVIHGAPDVDCRMLAGTYGCNSDDYYRTTGIDIALRDCRPIHGIYCPPGGEAFLPCTECGDYIRFLAIRVLEIANGAVSNHGAGYPNFNEWYPHCRDITHQKMYIDWMYRAYQGGQRVMVALALTSVTLAILTKGNANYHDRQLGNRRIDDQYVGDMQIDEMKKLVARHSSWMEIALEPKDVRTIVQKGKLAVILGVELDEMGNFIYGNSYTADEVRNEIRRLYRLGVRYVFPVHLVNNALGGCAVYGDMFNVANKIQTKRWWDLEIKKDITFKAIDFNGITQTVLSYITSGTSFSTIPELRPFVDVATFGADQVVKTILGQFGLQELANPTDQKIPYCSKGYGHANKDSLSALGEVAIDQMMKLGMMIDIDHMSERTFKKVFKLAAQNNNYPVNSGHNGIDIDTTVRGSENSRTYGQYDTINSLGGMAGVSIGEESAQWFIECFKRVSTEMDHKSLALGTDINGMYRSPCPPRYGQGINYAASGLPKLKTGNRTWDYNDSAFGSGGVANYGLLPDFLLDVKNHDTTVLNKLFSGAEGFYQMWNKAWQHKSEDCGNDIWVSQVNPCANSYAYNISTCPYQDFCTGYDRACDEDIIHINAGNYNSYVFLKKQVKIMPYTLPLYVGPPRFGGIGKICLRSNNSSSGCIKILHGGVVKFH